MYRIIPINPYIDMSPHLLRHTYTSSDNVFLNQLISLGLKWNKLNLTRGLDDSYTISYTCTKHSQKM